MRAIPLLFHQAILLDGDLETRERIPKSRPSIRLNTFDQMEVSMSDRLFDSPVFVKDGPFLVREIASLGDAFDFLDQWPEHDRDLIHETAWKACCDAHDGLKPVDAAEGAIRGFASKRGILEKPDVAIPWMSSKRSGGGRMQA
ncbi:DUF982 domain-containing protein [Brucella pseudogrignonensis]|nr:DUF982 domain-containing protein [Brucella pseudogrignonensis]UKK95272.1 DUF982 domain-containing protein [Brucella pseudogrignonensis]